MKKSLLYIWVALAAVLVFAFLPRAEAFAEEGAVEAEAFAEEEAVEAETLAAAEGYTFDAKTGKLTVFARIDPAEDELLDNHYPWEKYKNKIRSAVFKKGAGEVGVQALSGYKNLEEVTVEEGVTKIDTRAFSDCTKLKTLHLADSIATIGWQAFEACKSLTEIVFPRGLRTTEADICSACTRLEKVTFQDGVETIGDSAFGGCGKLKSVTLPDSITSIGHDAFYYCSSLTELVLPKKLTEIAYGLCDRCENLTRVTIPEGVTVIGDGAFNLTKLREIQLPLGLKRLEGSAFYGVPLTSVTIPMSVRIIEDDPFGANASGFVIYAAKDNEVAKAFAKKKGYTFRICSHVPDKRKVTKATLKADGKVSEHCGLCGGVTNRVIPRILEVSLSAKKLACNGKVQKPSLTVRDTQNEVIGPEHYSVTWSNAKSKDAGKYTATVTFKGKYYTGTKTLSYTLVPGKVKGLQMLKVTTSSVRLGWKTSLGAEKYLLQMSTDGTNWTNAATTSSLSANVRNLKAGTYYRFRVRAMDGSGSIKGACSAVLGQWTLCAAPVVTLSSTKSGKVVVSWKKVTGAKKYVVYVSRDAVAWTKNGTVYGTSCEISQATGGKKLYVKVAAVNVEGVLGQESATQAVEVKK